MSLSIPHPQTLSDIDWSNWKAKDPATLVFVRKENEVLLIRKKRGLGAGKINGPGGKLESNETLEECAIREVQEELKITVSELTCHGENLFQFTDGYSIHVHVYSTTVFQGTPEETEEAIPLWYNIHKMPYSEMWADDELWVPLMLAGKRFHGRFLFDGDRMTDYQLDEL